MTAIVYRYCDFAGRFFFGLDLTVAILIYLAVSVAFRKLPSFEWLVLAAAAYHAVDWDGAPYLAFRRWMRIQSHRVIGHHPLLVLPLAALIGWHTGLWLDGASQYGMALFTAAVFGHFVLDSLERHGLHWLSPFCWTSLSLYGGRPRRVPWTVVEETIRRQAHARARRGTGEIMSRMPQVCQAHVIAAGSAWILFFHSPMIFF